MKKILFLMLLLIGITGLFAQNGHLVYHMSGVITDIEGIGTGRIIQTRIITSNWTNEILGIPTLSARTRTSVNYMVNFDTYIGFDYWNGYFQYKNDLGNWVTICRIGGSNFITANFTILHPVQPPTDPNDQ